MDNNYIRLFTQIAKTTEILAEQVMDLNKSNKDENGYKTAETMRNDYIKLHDKLEDKNFNENDLTKNDYAKLLVGSTIVAQQISTRIETEKKVLHAYKMDTIPKLDRILTEAKTDEEARVLANELFKVQEEEKTNV